MLHDYHRLGNGVFYTIGMIKRIPEEQEANRLHKQFKKKHSKARKAKGKGDIAVEGGAQGTLQFSGDIRLGFRGG